MATLCQMNKHFVLALKRKKCHAPYLIRHESVNSFEFDIHIQNYILIVKK